MRLCVGSSLPFPSSLSLSLSIVELLFSVSCASSSLPLRCVSLSLRVCLVVHFTAAVVPCVSALSGHLCAAVILHRAPSNILSTPPLPSDPTPATLRRKPNKTRSDATQQRQLCRSRKAEKQKQKQRWVVSLASIPTPRLTSAAGKGSGELSPVPWRVTAAALTLATSAQPI